MEVEKENDPSSSNSTSCTVPKKRKNATNNSTLQSEAKKPREGAKQKKPTEKKKGMKLKEQTSTINIIAVSAIATCSSAPPTVTSASSSDSFPTSTTTTTIKSTNVALTSPVTTTSSAGVPSTLTLPPIELDDSYYNVSEGFIADDNISEPYSPELSLPPYLPPSDLTWPAEVQVTFDEEVISSLNTRVEKLERWCTMLTSQYSFLSAQLAHGNYSVFNRTNLPPNQAAPWASSFPGFSSPPSVGYSAPIQDPSVTQPSPFPVTPPTSNPTVPSLTCSPVPTPTVSPTTIPCLNSTPVSSVRSVPTTSTPTVPSVTPNLVPTAALITSPMSTPTTVPGPTSIPPVHSTPTTYISESPSTEPEQLLTPDEVIMKYPKLLNVSRAGRMAVRLACESYFGKQLLKKCTVYGQKGNAALPKDKVVELKKKMLSMHPQFIASPLEFEPTWTKCVNAINHCAASLRLKNPPSTIDLIN